MEMKRLARTKLRTPSGRCRKALLHCIVDNVHPHKVQPILVRFNESAHLVASASFSFPATIVLHGSEYHGDPAMNDGLSSPFTLQANNCINLRIGNCPIISAIFLVLFFALFYAGTKGYKCKYRVSLVVSD